MAEAVHGCLKEHLGCQATSWRSIGAEINARERNLGAGATVHSIKIMNEAFHGLKCLMLSIFRSGLNNDVWQFGFFEPLLVAISNIVFNFDIKLFAGKFFVFSEVFFEGFAESFIDARSHSVIEIRNRLATMLLVLIGLEDNGGKRSGCTNGLWGAEIAVTSIEAALEEFERVGLAAGKRASCHKIEIVNMNIAIIVCSGKFRL